MAKNSPQQILEAAAKVFAKNGYDDADIRTIAAQAGLNSALVAYHFGSKAGLFEAVVKSRTQPLLAATTVEDWLLHLQENRELLRLWISAGISSQEYNWRDLVADKMQVALEASFGVNVRRAEAERALDCVAGPYMAWAGRAPGAEPPDPQAIIVGLAALLGCEPRKSANADAGTSGSPAPVTHEAEPASQTPPATPDWLD